MNRRKVIPLIAALCATFTGCNPGRHAQQAVSAPAPHVVTADIQAGIEKHIAVQTRSGGGYFRLPFGEKELKLKLVRVHTEYLANLGPGRHFACVDLANTAGDVYDVDFFLAGDPGAMVVTETTVHKVNSQPLYLWEQQGDGTWRRVRVKGAPPRLMGVITSRDEFEFLYRVTLPVIAATARMWLPLPQTDSFQTVAIKAIKAPGKPDVLEDAEQGNQVLFLELGPEDSRKTVELLFQVQRLEKKVYAAQESNLGEYLKADKLVPVNDKFRDIAEKVVAGKTGYLERARSLYDHVIERLRYMKYGPGWGKGDAVYACDTHTGNCSDFHSYFIALARAVGIPARFASGAAIPSERNEGGIDGYHCWAEFYSDGQWWPVDISEGDKCSALATYYFGHHPANRFELSHGRDLVLEPGPLSGPINFLAYPVLEIDGRPAKAAVEFSFRRNIP